VASSGEDSLAIAEKENYDVALLDMKLPDCNGLELLQRLRHKQPEPTYILMTAYGSLDTAIQALKNGATDYILKPFSPDEVVAAVRKGFHLRDARREGQGQVEELQVQKQILEDKIQHLRKLNQIFLGREERIRELKRETNDLLRRLGQPPKYEETGELD